MSIAELNVFGIFDRQDIGFNFRRSPFFIVGPNGTGKSTALKILHGILTAQWDRLEDFPFVGVEIIVNDQSLAFDRADFAKIGRLRTHMQRFMRRSSRRGAATLPESWAEAKAILSGVSTQSVRITRRLTSTTIASYEEVYEPAAKLMNYVEQNTVGKVLYFPTYRRVERDLGELLEQDDDPFSESPAILPAIVDRFKSAGEVVGFGGQDIRALLVETAARIEVQARQALNEHSVRFLEALSTDQTDETRQVRAVIRSRSKTDRLLARISAFSNSPIDTDAIGASIDQLRAALAESKPGRLTKQQDVLLFYVGELITLFEKIEILSAPLRQFSDFINDYLKPIKSAYLREADNKVIVLDRGENEIELEQLSSGEKQILSFFAFLLLKAEALGKIIIIDEPELSLSVSWQKTLIADISKIEGVEFVVSATHSPFIFQSFPLQHVVSLGDL